jgi:hypothetical protein
LATPNYGYEKRQRELAKKQKKEQKLREKSERKHTDGDEPQVESGEAGDIAGAPAEGTPPAAQP